MKVHYLQHIPFEGLGYLEIWLKENRHEISVTRFYDKEYYLPSVKEIDALIILGGPMGVYDEHKYPWLHVEKAFIEDCIQAGKKVLGICLGAQLIAVCLGANVYTAANKEIGWFPVMPTEDRLSWFYELVKNKPVVFHWHGDKFEIPYNGSFNLLSSEANNNQAFCYNENVIGLQFHLEVTEYSVKEILENGAEELINAPYIQTADKINNGLEHIKECNEIMSVVLNTWLSKL